MLIHCCDANSSGEDVGGKQFSIDAYDGITEEDDDEYAETSNQRGLFGLVRHNTVLQYYKFELTEPKINIENISIFWKGKVSGVAQYNTYMYLWNHSYSGILGFISGKWDQVGSSAAATTLQFDFKTSRIDDYVGDDKYVQAPNS